MTAEQKRSGNRWVAWIGIAGTIFTIGSWLGQKGVDSVQFVTTTKNTNTELPKLVSKVDTLIMWRTIDKKSNDDLKEFLKDEFSRQRNDNIQYKKGVHEAVNQINK